MANERTYGLHLEVCITDYEASLVLITDEKLPYLYIPGEDCNYTRTLLMLDNETLKTFVDGKLVRMSDHHVVDRVLGEFTAMIGMMAKLRS